MKRSVSLLLATALSFAATGCGGGYSNQTMPEEITGLNLKAADIKDSGKKLTPEDLVSAWENVSGETCGGNISKDKDDIKFVECSDSAIMWSLPDSNDVAEKVRVASKRWADMNTEFDPSVWLVGPNWIINNKARNEDLFHKIGGRPVAIDG